ncbi:MAG: hypothetical protein M3386_00570, partial [Actinomycetota bacterium]|nr:hypothetical protein [Actinomycetota bacterium]
MDAGRTSQDRPLAWRTRRAARVMLASWLAVAVTGGSGLLVAPAFATDDDPAFPSEQQVRDARAAVESTAAAVGRIQAQLAIAQQELSAVQVVAAQKAEAYNGARYRLQQARAVAAAAQRRAARAAAEVQSQRDELEVFAVGGAAESSDLAQLGTVLSAGGPEELLAQYGAWSSTTSALQVDLDAWDAARTVAAVLRDDAASAVSRQRAAAAEAKQARA